MGSGRDVRCLPLNCRTLAVHERSGVEDGSGRPPERVAHEEREQTWRL